jgi:hypothetical protein
MNNDNTTLSGNQTYQPMKMYKLTSLTQDFINIERAISSSGFAAPILEPVKVTYIQSSILGFRYLLLSIMLLCILLTNFMLNP